MYNNGSWVIKRLRTNIPEAPFEIFIDNQLMGKAKLLSIAKRVPQTNRFPQVLVIYSSGYLRLKPGVDPKSPVPFGQSLVLGPAVFGRIASFSKSTLFFHPQIKCIEIYTSNLNRNSSSNLLLQITSTNTALSSKNTINKIMDLNWSLIMEEPQMTSSMLHINGSFIFTQKVVLDPVHTKQLQSFRLLQISSMFINDKKHDVDALHLHTEKDLFIVRYDFISANQLLPQRAIALNSKTPMFDSVHSDDKGHPNGNTPSYRIRINSVLGPGFGPILVRAFLNKSRNAHHDNLGIWAYQKTPSILEKGTAGNINYTVISSLNSHFSPFKMIRNE